MSNCHFCDITATLYLKHRQLIAIRRRCVMVLTVLLLLIVLLQSQRFATDALGRSLMNLSHRKCRRGYCGSNRISRRLLSNSSDRDDAIPTSYLNATSIDGCGNYESHPFEVRWRPMSGRSLLQRTVQRTSIGMTAAIAASISGSVAYAASTVGSSESTRTMIRSPRPFAWSIERSSPPYMQPRASSRSAENSLLRRIVTEACVLIVGTHPLSSATDDELLGAELFERLMEEKKKTAIFGKSQGDSAAATIMAIQALPRTTSCQMVVDEYMSSRVSTEVESQRFEQELIRAVSDALLAAGSGAESRIQAENCTNYAAKLLPIIQAAKRTGVGRVLCAGVPPTLLKSVAENGLAALSNEEKHTYVPDADGFVVAVQETGYVRYAERVLQNGQRLTSSVASLFGLQQTFESRIFEQEAVASALANAAPEAQVIAFCDTDDAIFGFGIQQRCTRNLKFVRDTKNSDSNSDNVVSLLLNPSAKDSRSPTKQLRLSLAYGRDVQTTQSPLLADFLWFSEYPPQQLLTRAKNPINREGDKPPGESSILKAF